MTKIPVVGLSRLWSKNYKAPALAFPCFARGGTDIDFRFRGDRPEKFGGRIKAGAGGPAKCVFPGLARPGSRGTARAASDP